MICHIWTISDILDILDILDMLDMLDILDILDIWVPRQMGRQMCQIRRQIDRQMQPSNPSNLYWTQSEAKQNPFAEQFGPTWNGGYSHPDDHSAFVKSTLSTPINERVSQSIIDLKDLKERESKSSWST